MFQPFRATLIALLTCLAAATAWGGAVTSHLISFQGRALDSEQVPLLTGDVTVRIYDAETAGTLVYDSGTEFNGAITDGVFTLVLGSGTPLSLDNTLMYWLELDLDGGEVIGDAAAGRQAFYPGGGSHDRPDLEGRLDALESLVFFSCDPGDFDLNLNPGDGCEFTLDPSGIYVSVDDPSAADDSGCGFGPDGTGNYPCRSVTFGIMRAMSLGKTTVYVADGFYQETIDMVDGISLRGAYRAETWERHLSSTATILQGNTASGHRKTVKVENIFTPTEFEGFVVYGQNNPEPGGNSYGVYVTNTSGLTLRDNRIYGGIGGPGDDGNDGLNGPAGLQGGNGFDAFDTGFAPCGPGSNQAGGLGGSLFYLGQNIDGGDGGNSICPPLFDTQGSGLDGDDGLPVSTGGSGGQGSYDRELSGSCILPTLGPVQAGDGINGANGTDGFSGNGAFNSLGLVSGNEWIGDSGSSGNNGTNGSGGGGGGAGGGADGSGGFDDQLGGTGGGGGSGGGAGTSGDGGQAGGGSFCIFVSGGSAPAIEQNLIFIGTGGSGGRGGQGGSSGYGGQGGFGGSVPVPLFCPGEGGVGGDGGNGGNGGGGGGGAGGVAVGIYTFSVSGSVGSYPGFNLFTAGAAGSGGSGGKSAGNSGTDGTVGSASDTVNQ